MDGPFHGQKPLIRFLHPHYPRRRSGQGVRRHSPGGESDRGEPVPTNATTWRNRLRLPSKACKLTAALVAKAYSAAGQAGSALHAMAILQVHQAKALKQVHEGSTDPGLMQELRSAPSPGGGPGGESSVSFCFCSAVGPRASGTHFLKKITISFSSGFSDPWCATSCFLTLAHDPFCQ